MGIINRTNDVSEQKDLVNQNVVGTSTGVGYVLYKAPRAQVITDAKLTSVGLSGTPTMTLGLQRFVAGAGLTTIAISGALTQLAIGTSGTQTFSLPAIGSSLLNLAAGDVLIATAGGTTAGVAQALFDVVVQNIADVKAWY